MSKIVESLITVGDGIHQIVVGPQTLYMIYFFAFLFGIYALVNAVFQRVAPKGNDVSGGKLLLFGGKPGKVIAFMISVITTGGIFYGGKMGQARSMEELLYLFNGFGGFLIVLFLAGGILALGFMYYNKNKTDGQKLSIVILLASIYIASSLLLPFFVTSANLADATINSKGSVSVGYVGYFTGDTFSFVYDFLDYVAIFSGFFLVIALIIYISSFFEDKNSTSVSSFTGSSNDKFSKDHEKRINDFKTLSKSLVNELGSTNTHFNNKVNLLNNMRYEMSKPKGGRS